MLLASITSVSPKIDISYRKSQFDSASSPNIQETLLSSSQSTSSRHNKSKPKLEPLISEEFSSRKQIDLTVSAKCNSSKSIRSIHKDNDCKSMSSRRDQTSYKSLAPTSALSSELSQTSSRHLGVPRPSPPTTAPNGSPVRTPFSAHLSSKSPIAPNSQNYPVPGGHTHFFGPQYVQGSPPHSLQRPASPQRLSVGVVPKNGPISGPISGLFPGPISGPIGPTYAMAATGIPVSVPSILGPNIGNLGPKNPIPMNNFSVKETSAIKRNTPHYQQH